jgi:ATP-dependent RNA helicase DeaD
MQSFKELGLSAPIMQALEDLGFENPTPIQQKAIPTIMDDRRDLVALAQTGTGKTAAFSLPVISLTDQDNNNIQSLILCPTRELCIQITRDVESFTKYMKGFKVTAVYGGASISGQISELKRGTKMVVGTPGRVLDLISRRALKIQDIKWLVLDEADEMLNMGFQEDLDSILSETPETKQTLLFSATMPNEIARIAKRYMTDPVTIEMSERNSGSNTISHEYYSVPAKYRYEVLKRIADVNPDIYGIVFCRTRRETKEIADKLMADGYSADALYGDLSQAQRDYVMGKFRNRKIQMLVATDVAARGIDVNDITHVINYDLPDELELYIHRSGRTGRAGKTGISISILHSRESRKLRDLERMVGQKFEQKPVPEGRDVCEIQLWKLVDKIEKIKINESEISGFMPAIEERFAEMSREDMLKRFISMEFNSFLNYYKNAPDLNNIESGRGDRGDRGDRGSRGDSRGDIRGDRGARDGGGRGRARGNSEDYTRFFINVGTYGNMSAARMMGVINEKVGHKDTAVGRIDIMEKFSFFEVEKKFENEILDAFKDAQVDGKRVAVEVAQPENRGGGGGGGGFRKGGGGGGGSRERRSSGGNDNREGRERSGSGRTRREDAPPASTGRRTFKRRS